VSHPAPAPGGAEREPSYLRLLLMLLGTATFFEGYDAAINGVLLPDLARSFGASTATLGDAGAVIGLGAFGAFFITALGDRFGRRPLLVSTTLAYALFTGLTVTASSVVTFSVFQFLARAFLLAELAIAITMVAEEFPPDRRGRAIGILTALGAFGPVAVGVLYRFLIETPLGWRAFYLIGTVPLVAVGFLRLRLRETRSFVEAAEKGLTRAERMARLRAALGLPYRRRLVVISAVYLLSHVGLLAAMSWWSFYAQRERGFSPADVSTYLAVGYSLGVTGFFVAGRLQDRWGRRPTGALFLTLGMTFGVALFQTQDRRVMFITMVLAVFFGLGVNPVLGALVSELFPTQIRSTSVAIARLLFGTIGGILGFNLAGRLGDAQQGLIGNIGDSVSVLALLLAPAAALLWLLPETAGRSLEDISAAPVQEGLTGAPTD
jgi:MFS family permease